MTQKNPTKALARVLSEHEEACVRCRHSAAAANTITTTILCKQQYTTYWSTYKQLQYDINMSQSPSTFHTPACIRHTTCLILSSTVVLEYYSRNYRTVLFLAGTRKPRNSESCTSLKTTTIQQPSLPYDPDRPSAHSTPAEFQSSDSVYGWCGGQIHGFVQCSSSTNHSSP